MVKQFIPKVKRENWNGKYVYVVRSETNRVITYKKAKGNNKKTLEQIFKDNKTFSTKFKKTQTKIGSETIVTTEYKPTDIKNQFKAPLKRQPKPLAMYSVEGYYNGIRIVANSMGDDYENGERISPQEKKRQAWESFFERIDQTINGGQNYDADEGIKLIDKITGLREGWVYYAKA